MNNTIHPLQVIRHGPIKVAIWPAANVSGYTINLWRLFGAPDGQDWRRSDTLNPAEALAAAKALVDANAWICENARQVTGPVKPGALCIRCGSIPLWPAPCANRVESFANPHS